MNKKQVLVIGAGGRVGYPFCGYAASKGYDVIGYDNRPESFERAENYIEAQAPPKEERQFTAISDITLYERALENCDVVVIMIGTPVDGEGNPRTEGLDQIRANIAYVLQSGVRQKPLLIVLRSTVSPGITQVFTDKLEKAAYGKFRSDLTVVFAPERIAQGRTYVEMPKLPQLIGATDVHDYNVAEEFFRHLSPKCVHLSVRQAELGKLMTNMYRYVNFALANEFLMICQRHEVDFEEIRQAINLDYPRMALEKAGPNAAGPCLFKDGQFLVDQIPHVDLIKAAFSINEGMPAWIYETFIRNYFTFDEEIEVGILGMTFKADNDDPRFSLSFKLKKLLERKGMKVTCYDPFLPEYSNAEPLKHCHICVVMTPHSCFDEKFFEEYIRPECQIIDIWKKFPESDNGTINGDYEKPGW
jgi:UDP-N-acetyl-D-mannosaminuronic acid dehydrogenase